LIFQFAVHPEPHILDTRGSVEHKAIVCQLVAENIVRRGAMIEGMRGPKLPVEGEIVNTSKVVIPKKQYDFGNGGQVPELDRFIISEKNVLECFSVP
jgi:hypothetical protein